MALTTPRVIVYGSCVARDTVTFLGDRCSLVQYSARQSIISAMSPPSALPAEPALDSAFQQRMVRDDFASSVARRIPEIADSIDLLLLDLVDERLDVIALPESGHITKSLELVRSGLLVQLPAVRPLPPFGSLDHFSHWAPAALRFAELLRGSGLLERTLLIDATFAAVTDAGEPVKRWRGKPAAAWNLAYRPYVELLADAGLRVHRIAEADAVSTAAHQWGPAPYHYVERAYRAIGAEIGAMTL